jgi:hypothetical protein
MIAVTGFSESNALRINKKIKPKEIKTEIKTFFKKMFKVRARLKNKGIKKAKS